MKIITAIAASGLLFTGSVNSGPLWDKAKEMTGSAAEIVGETATTVGKKVQGEKEFPDVTRSKIDAMETNALQRLFKEVPVSRWQFEESPAYAVFDTRKMSLLLTTGYGAGVAVNKETGERTYMKMAAGGLNLGYGAQVFQLIALFPAASSYNNFVTSGWDTNMAADAVAGKDAENAFLRLPDGTRVYKLNEKGVMLSATITGSKFWQWEELNK